MKNIANFLYIFLIVSTLANSCRQADSQEPATDAPAEKTDSLHDASTVEFTEAQYQTAGIVLGKVEDQNLKNVVKVNGVLDVPPQNLVSISAPLGGFVKDTDLLQGMQVRKGQILVTLQHPDYIQLQQDYLENKSQLEFMSQEYERQKTLSRENVSAVKVFQQTSAEYNSLKARVISIEEKLRLAGVDLKELQQGKISSSIHVYSPIDGYVSEVNINIGKYVNPTDVMLELIDTRHLHAELTVFEKDISKLRVGQQIRCSIDKENNRELLATVYLIGRKVSNERTIRVHAHLAKEDPSLIPGMYIKALIETGSDHKVTALPEQAIVYSEGKSYIFVFKRQHSVENSPATDFSIVEVQTGIAENGYIEVVLPPDFDRANTRVVTKGAFALLSKMKNSEEE